MRSRSTAATGYDRRCAVENLLSNRVFYPGEIICESRNHAPYVMETFNFVAPVCKAVDPRQCIIVAAESRGSRSAELMPESAHVQRKISGAATRDAILD